MRALSSTNLAILAYINDNASLQPYYRNYLSCDLGAMFEDDGFKPDTKIMASASKCLSFIEPSASSDSEVAVASETFNPSDN